LASTLAGVALSFASAGCGDGGGGTCGVAPCGGDVVGNWTASSACVDPAILTMDIMFGLRDTCPTAFVGAASLTPRGTLALAADMTFTGALDVDATVDVIFPPACVGDATCAQWAEPMQTLVGRNGVTAVSCAGTGSCTCTTLQTIEIINATGTWATSGTLLTFAEAPGGNGPYCVQGSSLHMIGLDAATMTKVANDIVLTRQ
jgi:hypothetical protein